METLSQKSPTSNLTIKLDQLDKERLKTLAIAKKRTAHYLMREAVQQYLNTEESQQRFIEAAKISLAEYNKTGLHITLDEFSKWAQAVKKSSSTPLPKCHK